MKTLIKLYKKDFLWIFVLLIFLIFSYPLFNFLNITDSLLYPARWLVVIVLLWKVFLKAIKHIKNSLDLDRRKLIWGSVAAVLISIVKNIALIFLGALLGINEIGLLGGDLLFPFSKSFLEFFDAFRYSSTWISSSAHPSAFFILIYFVFFSFPISYVFYLYFRWRKRGGVSMSEVG